MNDKTRPTIVIFGSSKPKPGSANYLQAYDLGKSLAQAGYQIANGGYGGTMEAAAKGAKESNAHTIGVTCDAFGKKGPNQWIDKEIRTTDLQHRLQTLVDLADAYLVLPGSTGTLLELATVWELMNKRFLPQKPIICLTDHWKPVIETVVNSGETNGSCIHFADTYEHVTKVLTELL